MPKMSRFRGPLDRQRGKQDETRFHSQREHLYHIHWSSRRSLTWKESPLVPRKTLRLFVNTLTAYDKYSLLSRDNLYQPTQMHLSLKQKTFPQFFWKIFHSKSNFEHFSKKMTLIAYLFPKLRTPTDIAR